MKRTAVWLVMALVGLAALGPQPAVAQVQDELTRQLVESYDLLEAGKLAQAKQLYLKILAKHPDNPLALNNLAVILVKEKDYQGALEQLEKALPKAKGYRVMVNKVCDVEGVCLAFRPLAVEYGNQPLEPLVRLNLLLIRGKLAGAGPSGK